jgi:hypothetical protein
MNTAALLALIQSDAGALALARAGNDSGCAARCEAIAPPDLTEAKLTELGVMSLYENPADAEAVLATIEAVAEGNQLVARVLKWIQPGAPGVNFGDARVRAMLVAPVNVGGVGLSQELATPLLQYAERTPVVSASDVAAARDANGGTI